MQISIAEVKERMVVGHAVITGFLEGGEIVEVKVIPELRNCWALCDEEFKQLYYFYSTI